MILTFRYSKFTELKSFNFLSLFVFYSLIHIIHPVHTSFMNIFHMDTTNLILTFIQLKYIQQNVSPIILDSLDANSNYEAFIVAVNAHGKSYPSPRLIFQTKTNVEADPVTPAYNMTTCCKHSG